MQKSQQELWQRFQRYYSSYPAIGLSIDLSRMNFPDDYFEKMAAPMARAFAAMDALEKGAIANPDENRMVGHYWLRNPKLAPTPEIRAEIDNTVARIKRFAADVHSGKIRGSTGPFTHLLLIGIGGSALGPQFVSNALGHPKTDKLRLFFLDNTDPDGMDKVFAQLDGTLARTLCLVVSKSGGTKETRNGMLETQAVYERAGLKFSQHAVAITGEGSALDKLAEKDKWLARFPMWDWVGGRTSQTSAVGLLPAALQGIDIDQFLAGAAACDEITRKADIKTNPAAQLALMWYYATDGAGKKDMVVLPYKDRLELFSRYLQQLVMESLGKERDLDGKVVNQGLTVFGNKGSTDQHAYVQQLREGLSNFFVIFIEVLRDRTEASPIFGGQPLPPLRWFPPSRDREALPLPVGEGQGEGRSASAVPQIEVDPQTTSGDYLFGFLMGTRQALFENARESVTLTLTELSPLIVGGVIALFERAVGYYAINVNVNAYHQPGVEAGKKAAEKVIDLQHKLLAALSQLPLTVAELAAKLGAENSEAIFKLCEHLAANGRLTKDKPANPFEARYRLA